MPAPPQVSGDSIHLGRGITFPHFELKKPVLTRTLRRGKYGNETGNQAL